MNDMDDHEDDFVKRDSMVERFFFSILFFILYEIAGTILWAITIFQFIWMMFNDQRPNDNIAEFGARLGVWQKRVTMYLSGASDEKPFPWREID